MKFALKESAAVNDGVMTMAWPSPLLIVAVMFAMSPTLILKGRSNSTVNDGLTVNSYSPYEKPLEL